MMFGMSPFERSDLRTTLRDWERDFLKGFVSAGNCRTDILEEPSRYILKCEMPGLDKKDIKVDMDGNILTLCARYQKDETNDVQENYIRRERTCESCCRRFDISGVQSDAVDASYQDGVLTVILPKKEMQKPATRRIEIK